MDRLWSQWRYKYVASSDPKPSCIFCDLKDRLVVHRGELCFVVLNLYPYTSGHLMVVPYAHVASLEEADEGTAAELMRLTRQSQRHLREVYGAPGFNIGMNIGECAGAGVAGHIHMHVLPRWPADANFMTTIGETRVLPEDIEITFKKVSDAFANG